ncbi:very long chain fatty acid elongase 6-like isoform X1 [Ornithodoros turicata]
MESPALDLYNIKPNYSFEFEFEANFNKDQNRRWMNQNWHTSVYWVGLYMLLIFGGQAYMAGRPAFTLRRPLQVWNALLAVFSIVGACRTLPELMHVLREFGFFHSVCNNSYIEYDRVSGFWTWMFVLSKVPELGDTIFIILRKRELIFLHWYHHITVLMFSWYFYQQHIAPARWYVVMNYVVHSIMYSYFALCSFRVRLPRAISLVITTLQIMQMMMGAYVTALGLRSGQSCAISEHTAWLAIYMYTSYFVLFALFFYGSYLKPKRNIKAE